MSENRSAEEIKQKLVSNPNDLAWKVKPDMRHYGYIVWYTEDGTCMSAMSIKDNMEDGRWGNFDGFDEVLAEYNQNTSCIEYNDNNGSLKVESRNDTNLVREIKDNMNNSDIVKLNHTRVGRLYLENR